MLLHQGYTYIEAAHAAAMGSLEKGGLALIGTIPFASLWQGPVQDSYPEEWKC